MTVSQRICISRILVFCALGVSGAGCFLISFAGGEELPKEEPDLRGWAIESRSLVSELSRIISKSPEYELSSTPRKELARVDEMLWQLWLTTGMPPLVKGDKSLDDYVTGNVAAYTLYLSRYGNLTTEEITRRGLQNCVHSYGSPLWHSTLQYLMEKATLRRRGHVFMVASAATDCIVEVPLRKEANDKFSQRMKRWLVENEAEFEWNASMKRLVPRDGKYIGTDILFPKDFRDLAWFSATVDPVR